MSEDNDTPWTPGPWRALPSNNPVVGRISTGKGKIQLKARGLPQKGEMNANVRLIAHAPQMIHFLEDLKGAVEERDDVDLPSDFWYDLLSLIGDIRDEQLVP